MWGRYFKLDRTPGLALDDHGDEDALPIGSNERRDAPKCLKTSQLGRVSLAKRICKPHGSILVVMSRCYEGLVDVEEGLRFLSLAYTSMCE